MSPAWITFLVLIAMVTLFITQTLPLSVTSLLGALTLCFLGVITYGDFYAALANPTLLLFAGMFVVGAALFYTGLAQWIGEVAVRKLGSSETRLLWITMVIAAVLSTFASNTGTTAALIPVVLSVCATAKIPASRQLMPLAFTSGYGGFSTLIGTPPNIIVSEVLTRNGYRGFGFFEFAWLGIPLAITGMLYLTWASKRFLPQRSVLGKAEENEEAPQGIYRPKHRWISGLILLGVVGVMALDKKSPIPLEITALLGALLCVMTGCLTDKQAFKSIEWDTLFLFAGMFCLAKGLEKSGVAALLADSLAHFAGQGMPGWALVAGGFGITVLLNSFISNTACAALLSPIVISVARGVGADPHPLLMAVAAGASCSFLTPIGTPPNTLVWKIGGYQFSDYARLGLGLVIVCGLTSVLLIPWLWPVYP